MITHKKGRKRVKIAIASGKGGTGKTTLSVNLTAWIRDIADRSVMLVDLDVEEPNTGMFLEGKVIERTVRYRKIPRWKQETCILSGECAGVCMYNAIAFLGNSVMVFPELCHGCYACSDLCPSHSLPMVDDRIGEVTLYQASFAGSRKVFPWIEGRLDVGREMATPMIAQTIRYAEDRGEKSQIILFDAPPGTSCSMMEAAKRSDYLLLVAEPTRFGLHDLGLAVKTLKKLGKPFAVVVNKDDPAITLINDFCAKEKIRIIARIPHLRKAAGIYAGGGLLYGKIPEIGQELEKVYRHILEISEEMKTE